MLFHLSWIPELGINISGGITFFSAYFSIVAIFLLGISFYAASPYTRGGWYRFAMIIAVFSVIGTLLMDSVFIFFLCWESAVLASFFAVWTSAKNQNATASTLRFILMSSFGSLMMFVGLLIVYLHLPPALPFNFSSFYASGLDLYSRAFVLLLFIIGIGIKLPLFPLHNWQAKFYDDSHSDSLIIIAGLVSKLGLIAIMTLFIPIAIPFSDFWQTPILFTLLFSSLYAAVIALKQKQNKRKMAFISMSHIGIMAIGFLLLKKDAISGTLIMMLSHALLMGLLFFVLQSSRRSKLLSSALFVTVFGIIAFPFTAGFVGEFLILKSLFSFNLLMAIIALLINLISGWVMLEWYKHTAFPEGTNQGRIGESIIAGILVLLILGIGIFPNIILQHIQPLAQSILGTTL